MPRLIALEARGQEFVRELERAWERGDAVLPVDPRLPAGATRSLTERLGAGDPIEPGTAVVVATSGSTGEPKGVVLDHAAVRASAEATNAVLRVDADRHRWLACLPLAHVGGLSVVTRALHAGTPLEVHERFDAVAVDRAAEAGCTHVSLVPTALGRIDAAAWERILLGGSAPPEAPPPNCVTTYGLTETGSGVVYDGSPLPGVEVRFEPDGEVLLRGPMVARRYRDGTPVTDADGWLHTGDLGGLGSDGRLTVVGRRDDVVVTGGENVHPEPVEARLRDHPGVADAAVVGRPDAEWGQRLVAVIAVHPGRDAPSAAELRAWVTEVLPPWAAPKDVEIRARLPRTPLGKLRRHVLR